MKRPTEPAGDSFIGAVFPHRFSRTGDPQIHVHCLAANMTMCGGPGTGASRTWRTLNAHHLYQHQKAAGYLFQAELRERLTERLGVQWTEVTKGSAEIVGVPRELAERLSSRREQITRELKRLGRSGSAREAELAALTTREAKLEFDLAEQRREWVALAQEHGFGPEQLTGVLSRTEFRELDREEIDEATWGLLNERGLTRERSAFARRDLVEAFAAAHARGGSVQRIEALSDRLIESDHLEAIGSPALQRKWPATARGSLVSADLRPGLRGRQGRDENCPAPRTDRDPWPPVADPRPSTRGTRRTKVGATFLGGNASTYIEEHCDTGPRNDCVEIHPRGRVRPRGDGAGAERRLDMTQGHIRLHDDDVLTVADAARIAQRSVRTIRRAYLSEKLVAHRDGNGRSVRIRYGDLRAWLMAEVISQATEPAGSQPVGRVRLGKRDEGRTKSGNLELLTAARARQTRASRVSSAGRPAERREGSRTV